MIFCKFESCRAFLTGQNVVYNAFSQYQNEVCEMSHKILDFKTFPIFIENTGKHVRNLIFVWKYEKYIPFLESYLKK